MKIATWNVNSIRTRLEHVTNWLQENPVDVLCMQETKVVDEDFPRSPLEALGYHLYIYGQKSYNGVALVSRLPLTEVKTGFSAVLPEALVGDLDDQKRVISGVVNDQLRLINLYVPNGSSVGSDKYEYKLRWLKILREYVHALMLQTPSHLLICGDFNIALEDLDIHNPKGRETMVMATDLERESLKAVLDLGLQDVFRKFNQEGEQYSWWDYRTAAFRRNAGWRIDHHYATQTLYESAKSCTIDVAPRKLEKPSDHAPVIVEL
jgi:exodeoxyribonuclease III